MFSILVYINLNYKRRMDLHDFIFFSQMSRISSIKLTILAIMVTFVLWPILISAK